MKRKQFSEEQIIGMLKEAEAGAVVTDLCRRHGMSSATYYAWKAKFGGLEVSDAKRLRALEEENARLKRLLADTMLDNAGLKDLLSKNGDACREAGSGRASPDGAGDERAAGVCCRRGGSHEHAVSLVPGG
jgi:transposase-like protein